VPTHLLRGRQPGRFTLGGSVWGRQLLWIRLEKTGLRKPSRSKTKKQNEGKNPHTEGGRHLRYPRTPGGQEEKFSWLSIMDGLSPALASGSTGGVDGSTRHSTTYGEVVKGRAVQAGRAAAWSRPFGSVLFQTLPPTPVGLPTAGGLISRTDLS